MCIRDRPHNCESWKFAISARFYSVYVYVGASSRPTSDAAANLGLALHTVVDCKNYVNKHVLLLLNILLVKQVEKVK